MVNLIAAILRCTRCQNYVIDTDDIIKAISQFNNFYTARIRIYTATFTYFFCTNSIIFLREMKKNKSGCFLLLKRHSF